MSGDASFGVRRVLAALRQQPTCRLRGTLREAQVSVCAVLDTEVSGASRNAMCRDKSRHRKAARTRRTPKHAALHRCRRLFPRLDRRTFQGAPKIPVIRGQKKSAGFTPRPLFSNSWIAKLTAFYFFFCG
jgi:hypothetical protein